MEAAFFDLDGTILALSSEKIFCWELYRKGVVSFRNLLAVFWIFFRYECGLVENYECLKRTVLKQLLRNLPSADIAARARQFFLERQMPSISAEALLELGRHRLEQRRLYLVSSTLDCLADPVGDHLGISHRYTTCLEIRDGCYTGQVLGEIYYGARKGELLRQLAVQEGIDLRKSFAYGDSIQDAAMLRAVGNPFAVNPDRQLESLARSQNWPVVRWS